MWRRSFEGAPLERVAQGELSRGVGVAASDRPAEAVVHGVPVRIGSDVTGELAGHGRDEDVVIGLRPDEGRTRRVVAIEGEERDEKSFREELALTVARDSAERRR